MLTDRPKCDIDKKYTVLEEDILSKCKWSPFTGDSLYGKIDYTIINGNIVYEKGVFNENQKGMRLVFDR